MFASVVARGFALFCVTALTHSALSALQPTLVTTIPIRGQASFYGEAHRGKLMANGQRFDPEKLTAASWFFPLGTRLRVTRTDPEGVPRSLVVTVTDRGPAHHLVQQGRIIDLSEGAFRMLSPPAKGLVQVKIEPVD